MTAQSTRVLLLMLRHFSWRSLLWAGRLEVVLLATMLMLHGGEIGRLGRLLKLLRLPSLLLNLQNSLRIATAAFNGLLGLTTCGLLPSVAMRLLAGSDIASTIALLPTSVGAWRQAHRATSHVHGLTLSDLMVLRGADRRLLISTTPPLRQHAARGDGMVNRRLVLTVSRCLIST